MRGKDFKTIVGASAARDARLRMLLDPSRIKMCSLARAIIDCMIDPESAGAADGLNPYPACVFLYDEKKKIFVQLFNPQTGTILSYPADLISDLVGGVSRAAELSAADCDYLSSFPNIVRVNAVALLPGAGLPSSDAD